jgi:transcriptional regulator with XRE-family HTH domain
MQRLTIRIKEASMSYEKLQGWQIRAARVAAGLTTKELCAMTGTAETTLRKLEADGPLQVRHDARMKIEGGVDVALVAKIVKALREHGFELRPACSGWPACVVKHEAEATANPKPETSPHLS